MELREAASAYCRYLADPNDNASDISTVAWNWVRIDGSRTVHRANVSSDTELAYLVTIGALVATDAAARHRYHGLSGSRNA
jgi:hypothetical protein